MYIQIIFHELWCLIWVFDIAGCLSEHPYWIGDGYCHDELNNEDCSYDGGDCCGTNVNTNYCTECTCYDEWCFLMICKNPIVILSSLEGILNLDFCLLKLLILIKIEALCTKNEDFDQIYLNSGLKIQNVEELSLDRIFHNHFW